MTPRAIFFDLDDTLLDGVQAATIAWQAVTAAFGPELGIEPEKLREAIHRETANFWRDEAAVGHWRVKLREARELCTRRALEAEGLDGSDAGRIAGDYLAEHRANLHLFDDSIGTLESVREAGYKLGLLTNGPREMQRGKIDRFELEDRFDVIVIEGEFGHGKPEHEVFEHAMTTVGSAPAESWHIGDNLYADIGGAQRAGLHGVWIHRERLKKGDNPAADPDREIGHLPELLAVLGV